MSTEVVIHEPTHDATVRVLVRRKMLAPWMGAVRSFVVVAYTTFDAPPLLVLPTKLHTRERDHLKLWPGQRVELAGIAALQKNSEIFHGGVAWGIHGIDPPDVFQQDFEIQEVYIDGHRLGTLAGAGDA